MGNDKRRSKGGNYVGGFLQMFDWNAKSRKKLFSAKYDSPEQSKQKKRCDGNFPTTRLHMLDEDEISVESSVKGSGCYSCASSVTDEEPYRTKAPGVVARLMGLDSLPKSNVSDPYSTPLFESQSLKDGYYYRNRCSLHQDQFMQSNTFQELSSRDDAERKKHQKVIHRPIEKFQVETLPPKSAKSIPVTHHKLLSPIKNANYTPSKDAAHIMEAAARIIEPGTYMSGTKPKLPHVGSSLVPLRVRDLKEKVQATQKLSKTLECSQKKAESYAVKSYLKGQSVSYNSWNGSGDETLVKDIGDSEVSSSDTKRGRSISLALQAKANVQKREGLTVNSSRSQLGRKETSDLSPKQVFKSKSSMDQTVPKVPFKQHGSNVLRQNNQKQNCTIDRDQSSFKSNSHEGKTLGRDVLSARQRNVGRLSGNSMVNSRKLSSEDKKANNSRREASSSNSQRITSKKRSVDENHYSEGSQTAARNKKIGKNSNNTSSWDQDSGSSETEVVSFTFTAPMTRSEPGFTAAGENSKICSAGSLSKRTILGSNSPKYSFLGHNVKGGDELSTLLEEKLKELAHKVEVSHTKQGTDLHDEVTRCNNSSGSSMLERNLKENAKNDNLVGHEEALMSGITLSRHPSPVSILEHPSVADSCNSWDTAYSYTTGGQSPPSFQAPEAIEMLPLETHLPPPKENAADFLDSASSENAHSKQQTTLTEIDYVKDIICNVELMFKDYALGANPEVIDPYLFDRLECSMGYTNDSGVVTSRRNQRRRLMFDCVNECLGLRFRVYASGGFKLWAKGESVVRRKEKLAEEVYKEISDWSAMGDAMVDQLVDKDMSSSQCGRWLDYDVQAFQLGKQMESRILNSLIDEVVADLLVL